MKWFKRLKVFKMNDYDWFADYSKEEAIIHYKETMGTTDDEIDEVEELSKMELKEQRLVFVDEPKGKDGKHPSVSFYKFLKGMKRPDIFASTEY